MAGRTKRKAITLFLALLALLVAALVVLPLPFLIIVGLVGVCAVLSPATPLVTLTILLSISPLRTLIATEADLAFPLDIGQLLLLLYFGAWLCDRIRRRQPVFDRRGSVPLTAVILLAAVFTLGVWTSASTSSWLREWLKWVVMAFIIWSLSRESGDGWRLLVFAILISAVANALVGLYIFFGGSGADHLVILGRFFRAFGTFGQPNPFGGFMGIALPLALVSAYGQLSVATSAWRRNRRLPAVPVFGLALSGLASLVILMALLASWSRGAWLGIGVATLVMLFALPKRIWNGVMLAGLIVVIFALVWAVDLLPSSIVSRLTTTATELVSFSDVRGVNIYPSNYAVIERLAHWQAATNMAAAAPLFGLGLGSYEVVYEDYRLINWKEALGHAHNQYLNLLAETGFVGVVAYCLFWLIILRLTWATRRHPDAFARAIAVGLLGSWTYIAVHSLFDNLFVNNLFFHIGVLLGILAILSRQLTRSLRLD